MVYDILHVDMWLFYLFVDFKSEYIVHLTFALHISSSLKIFPLFHMCLIIAFVMYTQLLFYTLFVFLKQQALIKKA